MYRNYFTADVQIFARGVAPPTRSTATLTLVLW